MRHVGKIGQVAVVHGCTVAPIGVSLAERRAHIAQLGAKARVTFDVCP